MGTDIHIVIERRGDDGRWETLMQMYDLGRNYELFEKIQNKGNSGLPENASYWTQHLFKEGLWGKGWMWMSEFRKLKHVGRIIRGLDLIKKKDDEDLRVIYAFDS